MVSLAQEAGAAVAADEEDDALGAVRLLQSMPVKSLPPTALASLLPLVHDDQDNQSVLQEALRAVLPPDMTLSAQPQQLVLTA